MAARSLALWLVTVIAWVSTAMADDLYVDNISGDDRQPGRVSGQPLKTIQAALLRSRPGDRIILTKSDVPYREQLSIMGSDNSGFRGQPLEIIGNGATLEGSNRFAERLGRHLVTIYFNFDRLVLAINCCF